MREWEKHIKPQLLTIENMSIKKLEQYHKEYSENKGGIRDWLIDWAHYSNVFLPPLWEQRKNPLGSNKKEEGK